jgi:hypothetical protein
LAIYREQDAFVKDLFTKMSPRNGEISDERNRNMRRLEQIIMFETFHETALTADQDSLLKDLLRGPATPQPFEVQIQTPVEDLESIRSFDGNLKSGADQLELRIDRPVTIRYFMDRAPGFLANVDNKLGWGFFDSVFDMKKYVVDPKFRKPIFVAEAAHRLFARLGYKNPPSAAQLTSEINDRSGQPELWNYFSMADARVISLSQIEILNVATADEIHATWRRGSAYNDRWKPASAKLIDGSIVNNKWALQKYLAEKKVPDYLHQYYKLEQDAASGEVVLYEDIRNLPNQYLADNHQGENLISAYVATSIIDRMWQNSIEFKTVAKVEKWLVVAAHMVHQAVLDRNANNARNNPEYNVPWSKLPARNKKNDLEILRVAFEQRLRIKKDGLSDETITIIKEGFSRLGLRIQQNESFGLCDSVQGVTEK